MSERLSRSSKAPLYAVAFDAIRTMILEGRLRPNESVTEAQLASELGISRTPIREAIRRLASEGYIEATPQHGLKVYAPTPEDVADVYVSRALIEGFAGRLATVAMTDEQIADLARSLNRCQAALDAGRIDEATSLSSSFHDQILEAARNHRLKQLLAHLAPIADRYRHIPRQFADHLQRAVSDHVVLLDLIASRRADEVEDAMRRHILSAGLRVVRTVEMFDGRAVSAQSPSMKMLTDVGSDASLATNRLAPPNTRPE